MPTVDCAHMYFPWCLLSQYPIKPPIKESTRPVDLKLHTDVRAVERAEFDHQVLL